MATVDKNYYKDNDGMLWEENPGNGDEYIWRYSKNPLFDMPKEKHFWHIFNSAAAIVDGKYIGVFRCEDKLGTPDLFLATSDDGAKWDIETTPIVFYNKDGSRFTYPYAYDPRLVKLEDAYYVTFCADIEGPSIYTAKTTDFKYFEMLPTGFMPSNRNGVLFPEKVNGKYLMLSRPFGNLSSTVGIYISESPDLVYWGNHKMLMKNFYANNYWERIKIGAGPAPIKTDEGWILIYHGVQKTCNGLIYSVGVAVLDLEDPTKVKYRGKRFIMTPEMDCPYETTGFTPNVIFPCSALVDSEGHVTIYYGAADTNMGIAFTTVDKLIEFAKEYN